MGSGIRSEPVGMPVGIPVGIHSVGSPRVGMPVGTVRVGNSTEGMPVGKFTVGTLMSGISMVGRLSPAVGSSSLRLSPVRASTRAAANNKKMAPAAIAATRSLRFDGVALRCSDCCCRSRGLDVEQEDRFANADQITAAQWLRAHHSLVVQECAVGRAHVVQEPAIGATLQVGMAP